MLHVKRAVVIAAAAAAAAAIAVVKSVRKIKAPLKWLVSAGFLSPFWLAQHLDNAAAAMYSSADSRKPESTLSPPVKNDHESTSLINVFTF